MSETNGKAKKSQTNRLSRDQWYKVLMAFKEMETEFVATRPTLVEAAEKLTTMVGFPVSYETVKDMRKMTGITWAPNKSKPRRAMSNIHKQTALRALARAVEDLYRDLGKDVPEGITSLMKQLDSRRRGEEDAALPSSK